EVAAGRHPVVDPRGRAERDVSAGTLVRDEPPPPPAGHGGRVGPDRGSLAFVFRVVVEALAEEKRVTGAVGDVREANVAADEEDAVLAQAGKVRRAAGEDRPHPGVAAVTAHSVGPAGPQGDRVECREFPYGVRQ